ncbi:glutamyl-tRNA(Gln) amidotransferase subunit B, mitochondrial isoform X1 [Octopus sinensis]|uniref:Glutamyl-tRNA(Gln) amidotransferase subunit B, mitochondrial n=1 Tax=Octopus sinensis TaxID=2607531 RepID=A0A6P7T1K3_9MOLL|nr:glutamyl-tRNA(Gln) amidotransferase subunit B, mitochondrial isoform X1 [Octopus sinensis]
MATYSILSLNRVFIPRLKQIRTLSTQLQRDYKEWCGVIGLEIHAQILSESKMFSGSATTYGAPTNTQVSFFDAALPGTLPVLNKRCLEAGVLTSLALGCNINKVSLFDRKHYFYADLPAGYQITQYFKPLAQGGKLKYYVPGHSKDKGHVEKEARITQIQLEVDSGKSLHDYTDRTTLIDLNRAGMGLMEIVTEPDFKNGEEAAAFLKELQLLLMTLGTCNGKMSEGSLRVDANISIHRPSEPYGVRTEVKNINSIRNVAKAIDYEIERQIVDRNEGKEIENETRSFDSETGETVSMRDKEGFQDYRFMPEPNLLPVHVYDNSTVPCDAHSEVVNIDTLREQMPELPNKKREHLQKNYNLSIEVSNILLFEDGLLQLFEDSVNASKGRLSSVQIICNFLMNEFLQYLNALNTTVKQSGITAVALADICDMLDQGEISRGTAKEVLLLLFEDPSQTPSSIVQSRNWNQIQNVEYLEKTCSEVIENNAKAVKKYKKGKTKAINSLIGEVIKKTGQRADPVLVNNILKKLLE